MLTSRLGSFEGLRVADLFAGSGALGLEALSRGAAQCLFVEQEKPAVDAIKANVLAFDARDRSTVQIGSVMSLGPAKEPFDLLLLDPPYRTGASVVALDRLHRLGWIGPATWIAVEASDKESIEVKGLEIAADRKVGKARLTLLTSAD
jgi:16S rRNA (guanine966-N2)-methyltransferase